MNIQYRMIDEKVNDYQKHEKIIKTIEKRFQTYGYKQIKTSPFEYYDLYSKVNSSINQNEMIKVIDYTGQVLVLRPDVTIPITRQLAQDYTELPSELRYFYVQDVFRQPFDQSQSIERTQAGIEYFGENSAEADAEVIALACHTLKSLGLNDIKIEIGHARFFQELINGIKLTPSELGQLKNLIQAKNGVEIAPFLRSLAIENEWIEAIEAIPFLYGDPKKVSMRAKEITRTKKMDEKLDHLMNVYEILKMYGLEKSIVMDLGLINHMGYYSDIIFQGFVGKFGKPVLMGGRYNRLGNQFGATLPAIGFACTVDSLVEALGNQEEPAATPIDVKIMYESRCLNESIQIANDLRERGYNVLSYRMEKENPDVEQVYKIELGPEKNTIHYQDRTIDFTNTNELLKLMEGGI